MNRQQKIWTLIAAVLLAPLPIGAWALGCVAFQAWRSSRLQVAVVEPTLRPVAVQLSSGMVRIAGGRFRMGGSNDSTPDRLPAHLVGIDAYWIDQQPVTNRQFRAFVMATSYVTTAEQRGDSLLFDADRSKWHKVVGANWHKPFGPRSTLMARDDFPVVHVSWHDAAAYAAWAGKRLVSEAEYEQAARGGLLDAPYAWGEANPTTDQPLANYWQGRFPVKDLGLDGFRSLAPVGQFPPNRFGLYDMVGNTWCWCNDWYDADYYVMSPTTNPPGPNEGTERLLRGGSWLSTAGTSSELEVAARGHASPDHTAVNVSFRCARSTQPRSTQPNATLHSTVLH